MKRAIVTALAFAAAASLSACAGGGQFSAQALGNLQYCERAYTAIVGGLGTNGGSINIRCPARPYPDPATAEAAVLAGSAAP